MRGATLAQKGGEAQHLQMMRDGGLSYLDAYRDVAYTRLAAAVAGNHTE